MTKRKLGYFALGLLGLVGLFTLSLFWRSARADIEDEIKMDENISRVMEGTIIAILEDEVLFVNRLNLSEDEKAKAAEDWFESDIYRLTGIESDVRLGSEIRIQIGITTMSIPPLAPVVDYEIINF